MPSSDFDQLQSAFSSGGAEAALAQAAKLLREQKKYHELFEVLKMQVRRKLDLPLLPGATDELPEETRAKLEDGLIASCREVGSALLQEGKIREGWMYLRPVGDRAEAASLMGQIEPDEENYEDLIEVCLHEGVDIGRGYGLVLEHYGTCNAITQYDSSVVRRPRAEQAPAAQRLLQRVHADLVHSVKADIARQEGQQPAAGTLKELLADRDWLFQDNAYHLDTTHLAACVRISRVLSDPADLRMALDLTEYGRRLSQQFQYQGDEPFADIYPANALYFQALLGENIEEAIEHFKSKAEMLDPQYHGYAAIETYVDLLARLGRHDQALAAAVKHGVTSIQPLGNAPPLVDLAQKSGQFQSVLDHCRAKEDVLGFAAALVQSSSAK
ncbi:MAG TPA: hypothetical protein VFV87_01805 [Pirellulaceae bacterium]|nr:hypothetical protein [Pirellulaceae bacterium]